MKPSVLLPALADAFADLKGVLWTVGLASGVINLLALTGSFYMLQIYDRVSEFAQVWPKQTSKFSIQLCRSGS